MIYLIDGHNLIGKMPTIELSDPDDEEKLIRRLQNWAGGSRKRRVRLYFDSGPVGGFAPHVSRFGVQVHYAKMGQTADDLLVRQLKKLKNPQAYTLVTSDREIIAAARKRRVGYVLSEEFIELMAADEAADRAALESEAAAGREEEDPGAREDPDVSDAEVAEWLAVFKEPKRRPKPKPPKEPKSAPKLERKQAKRPEPTEPTAEELKAGATLSQEDLEAWLAVFGDVPEEPLPKLSKTRPSRAQKRESGRKKKKSKPTRPAIEQKYGDEALTDDELDEWLDLFDDIDKS